MILFKFRIPLYTDDDGDDHNIWDPVTDPRRIRVLEIKNEVRMVTETAVQRRRLKFWESLGLTDTKAFVPID